MTLGFQSDGSHECGVFTRKRAIDQHTSGMPNQHISQMPQPSFQTSSLPQTNEVEDHSSSSLPWVCIQHPNHPFHTCWHTSTCQYLYVNACMQFGNKDTRTMSENWVEPNYSPNNPVRSFLERNEGILPAPDRWELLTQNIPNYNLVTV